jgi:pimeloyl-ACP methyl ester carboxylesterase
MKKILIWLSLGLIVGCSVEEKKVDQNQDQVQLDEGQFDSIIIQENTIAPTKAIKALENRAYFLDSFPSLDSLTIYADIYIKERNAPTILFCHQAGYSRGEYKETAKKLNLYGYSVVALDQRSGGEVNGIKNLSYQNALNNDLPTSYIDAYQDIEAAIDYIYHYTKQPLLLVGSSYSASLSLLAGKNNPKIKAVASFSPGEYFDSISITDSLKSFDKPLFITSSKQEASEVTQLISKVEPHLKHQFIPELKGYHGSKALWSKNKGNEKYWEAFNEFLKDEFPTKN